MTRFFLRGYIPCHKPFKVLKRQVHNHHSQKVNPALKRLWSGCIMNPPKVWSYIFPVYISSIDFYLFILFRKHSLSTNASISVIKIPLGKQARSLFCVFLPPSSNEIQLQLHAIYLRHHECGASCATFRFLLRKQRESRI